jgi:glycosyltransferase involved in cell wall biosynthesis
MNGLWGVAAVAYVGSLAFAHQRVMQPGPGPQRPARYNVSLIVPALDEEKYIGRLLDSAAGQTEPFAEIIIANSGADRTEAIALEAGAMVVPTPRGNISAARNAGAEVATGDILVFADADVHFAPEFLERAINGLEEGYLVVFPREVLYDSMSWNTIAWAGVLVRPFTHLSGGTTRCIAVSREVFDAVGGYDIDCNPLNMDDQCREDLDFGIRVADMFGGSSLKLLPPLIATSARRQKAFGFAAIGGAGLNNFDQTPRRFLDVGIAGRM